MTEAWAAEGVEFPEGFVFPVTVLGPVADLHGAGTFVNRTPTRVDCYVHVEQARRSRRFRNVSRSSRHHFTRSVRPPRLVELIRQTLGDRPRENHFPFRIAYSLAPKLRSGIAPLYTRHVDVWAAVSAIVELLDAASGIGRGCTAGRR